MSVLSSGLFGGDCGHLCCCRELGRGTDNCVVVYRGCHVLSTSQTLAPAVLTPPADLDPAQDGLGGSDHAFAISITGAPSINLMDTLTLDLSGLASSELDVIWSYIASDNFKFQLTISSYFELSGLLDSVPFLKDALEELLNAKGQASVNLYVDHNQAAIFLDLQGEIDVLPVLDIPPVDGELGVLLSVGYGGTADDLDIALVIDGELYCLSSYGRGVGTPLDACPSGTVQDPTGLLCYPACTPGYSMVGPVCWQDCPADFSDDGAFCGKPGEPHSLDWLSVYRGTQRTGACRFVLHLRTNKQGSRLWVNTHPWPPARYVAVPDTCLPSLFNITQTPTGATATIPMTTAISTTIIVMTMTAGTAPTPPAARSTPRAVMMMTSSFTPTANLVSTSLAAASARPSVPTAWTTSACRAPRTATATAGARP